MWLRVLICSVLFAAGVALVAASPAAAQQPTTRCDFTDINPQTGQPCLAIGKYSSPGGLVGEFTSDIPNGANFQLVGEEAPGGFFDSVRGAAPRFGATIEALREDHRLFLKDVDALATGARACLAGPVAEVLKQAAELGRRLRDHETREGEVLLDALYDDVGETE